LKDEGSISNKISAAMYEDIKSDLVTVSHESRGVVVHLAEELLFASGSADLKKTSLKSMDVLASVLRTLPNEIRIEGHTDDIPINNELFPSNWQ
jgi:chemotaxis protein MotB